MEYMTRGGKTVIIRDLDESEEPKKVKAYINALVRENTCILMDTEVSLKKEKEWLRSKLQAMSKGDSICLVVEDRGRIAGIVNADREPFKMRNNVVIGIALLPDYRGQGLGRFVMTHLINRIKKEMKPKNIHLRVFACNSRAMNLYRSLGFKDIAVLPDWVHHGGRYVDEHIMLLR
jgi:RimJ/RimL family protein N-acetyltransferase